MTRLRCATTGDVMQTAGQTKPCYTGFLTGQGTGTASAVPLGSGVGTLLRLRNTHATSPLYYGMAAVTTANGAVLPAGQVVEVYVPDLGKVCVVGNGVTFAWELYQ